MTSATSILTLTTADFDQQLTSAPEPILIEFWAEGCGPCKALLPILEEIAAEHAGRLRIGTLRLDDAPGLARRFDIMALPTLIVFTAGRPVRQITNVAGKTELPTGLGEFLNKQVSPTRHL